MHELSIAQSLVELVESQNSEQQKVAVVELLVGALSAVHEGALQFSYELVTEGTMLEGSKLEIEVQPVVIYCPGCQAEFELPSIQRFRCPECDQPSDDIRRGKELDLKRIHFSVQAEV